MNRKVAVGLTLLVGLLATGGCRHKIVYLVITNHAHKHVEVEIEGPHEGEEDIGHVPAGGTLRYDLKVPNKKLPADFELEAGRHETEFTVNSRTPSKLWVDITPDGILGPRRRPR